MLEVLVTHYWGSVLLKWFWCRTGNAVLWWDHAQSLGCGSKPCSALGLSAWSAASLGGSSPWFGSAQAPGGEPCEAFPSSSLKLCIPCSAASSKVVDGSFVDLPVNLVFLHGLGAQWEKFGFQTPAWFHSYPYDQQMELREYCFLEEKEMDFLQFLTWNWSSTSSPVLFFPLLISC